MDTMERLILEKCLKYNQSFKLGKRGAGWKFIAAVGYAGYEIAICERASTTLTNIDYIGIEHGQLTCYADGGSSLIACINLDDYLTCEALE